MQAVQILNIARDVVTDSEELGRCYVPKTMLKEPEIELNILRDQRSPWTLGEQRLRWYRDKLVAFGVEVLEKSTTERQIQYPKEVHLPLSALALLYIKNIICLFQGNLDPRTHKVSKNRMFLNLLYFLYVTPLVGYSNPENGHNFHPTASS